MWRHGGHLRIGTALPFVSVSYSLKDEKGCIYYPISSGRRKQRAEALSYVLVLSLHDWEALRFYTEMFKGDVRNNLSRAEDDHNADILIHLIRLAKLLFYQEYISFPGGSGFECIEEMRSTLLRLLREARWVLKQLLQGKLISLLGMRDILPYPLAYRFSVIS